MIWREIYSSYFKINKTRETSILRALRFEIVVPPSPKELLLSLMKDLFEGRLRIFPCMPLFKVYPQKVPLPDKV
jgi:hypothetical protein